MSDSRSLTKAELVAHSTDAIAISRKQLKRHVKAVATSEIAKQQTGLWRADLKFQSSQMARQKMFWLDLATALEVDLEDGNFVLHFESRTAYWLPGNLLARIQAGEFDEKAVAE